MSRGAPLGWTQFQARHSFFDSARRQKDMQLVGLQRLG